MDALTCLLGVTARKSLSLNCISLSRKTTLLLNVTKTFHVELKNMTVSGEFQSQGNLILLFVLQKQWSLRDDRQSFFIYFFFVGKVRGRCIMSSWPWRSLWLFLKTHLYSLCVLIKTPAGQREAGSRDESVKIQKCHQPHRGDVSQGTLTGRQFNWLWQLLYHIKVHFCRKMSHYTKGTLQQDWIWQNQEPGNLIILSVELFNLRADKKQQIHKMASYDKESQKRMQYYQQIIFIYLFFSSLQIYRRES